MLNRVAPAVAVGRLVPSMIHAAQQPLLDLPPSPPIRCFFVTAQTGNGFVVLYVVGTFL